MTISPKPGEGKPCRMARVDGGEIFPLVREEIVSTEVPNVRVAIWARPRS